MHSDHHFTREVMNFIGYFAGQATAVKTMKNKKRNYSALAQMLLSALGNGDRLFSYYYAMLHDLVMDITNTMLDHPGLDDETRSKVHEIRVSANKMKLFKLAQTVEKLALMQNKLSWKSISNNFFTFLIW